ncbi:MAG TPA: agmatine deiminase family protein [Flavobacteriales bacterium]|nr:agmatine deiminase family protein [Flavobacteriales bacterium]
MLKHPMTRTPTKAVEFPSAATFQIKRTAAEFEPQACIWLAWPRIDFKKGMSAHKVHLQIIKALAEDQNMKILVQDAAEKSTIRQLLTSHAISLVKVEFIEVPFSNIWLRDIGPVLTTTTSGHSVLAKFDFNTWGYLSKDCDESQQFLHLFKKIAQNMKLASISSHMICEAGNHELNGKGTLMLTKQVALQRNPNMSVLEMEKELRRMLGVSNIIWLPQGVYEDDMTFEGPMPGGIYTPNTTGGHIDEYARFTSADTIALASISEQEIADEKNPDFKQILLENKRRLDAAHMILKQAKDQDGKPFNIVSMPVPELMVTTMQAGDKTFEHMAPLKYKKGHAFKPSDTIKVAYAASYLNFVIANKVVLMQTYWAEGKPTSIREKDQKAMHTLKKLFPSRTIIPIDATAINVGGGGIHCITMHEPSCS